MNICPGGTRVFTCQDSVATTSSPVLPMIHWRIQFKEAGLSDVHQSYIPSDLLGDVITDHRSPGYTFTFNLTASSALHLVSTLMVTLDANSIGRDQTSLGVATVGCNEQNASATLYITTSKLISTKKMYTRNILLYYFCRCTVTSCESEANQCPRKSANLTAVECQ